LEYGGVGGGGVEPEWLGIYWVLVLLFGRKRGGLCRWGKISSLGKEEKIGGRGEESLRMSFSQDGNLEA